MTEQIKSWRTENPNVFQIGEYKVTIAKKGRAQAEQIAQLNSWLKEHIAPLSENLKGVDQNNAGQGFQVFTAMMGELTVTAQLELAQTLLGKVDVEGKELPADLIDKEYDINWVVDALQIAGQGAAVQRLLTAFFTNVG